MTPGNKGWDTSAMAGRQSRYKLVFPISSPSGGRAESFLVARSGPAGGSPKKIDRLSVGRDVDRPRVVDLSICRAMETLSG